MPCEVHHRNGRVYVSGEMNIYCAAAAKDLVFTAVRANLGEAAIDLSQVSEIDTAGLQILVMARRMSVACGSELRIINPSTPAREALELCGLAKLISTETRADKRRKRPS